MALGKKTGGRKKGTPNKTTQKAKDAIDQAAQDLGGAERLVAWVQEDPLNERAFWSSIYTKLLPLQVNGDPESPLHVVNEIKRTIVDPKSSDS